MEETAEHIGEYMNLYQVHSATFESGILSDERVHQALHKCRQERGWAIGLSVSGTVQDDIIRQAMTIHVTDNNNNNNNNNESQQQRRLFDSVQCTYNLLEQRPYPALIDAHNNNNNDNGLDIIVKEGMANGRVLQNTVAQTYASSLSCQADQLALGSILAQPFQPRVLSGAVTPDQLISNMKALDISQQLLLSHNNDNNNNDNNDNNNDNKSLSLSNIMKDCCIESDKYWKDRSNLAWN